ncbi:hypothetical protein AZE42_07569 [Rhizopogon vesiculosus]|uniref:Uncharacterized protein n=1 Tax=Rhizopogon vesiculosus TaxID=180088 RepID=A0A1J8PH41_9AGAM|nr:hypothetical protein AZE42_07569 [Rhizopogon vesiculosus]
MSQSLQTHSEAQPAQENALAPSQSAPLQSRRWNASLIPVRISRHSIDVAPCRPPEIYGMAPLTEAEIAAGMQDVTGNEVNGSAQPGRTAVEVQRPQQSPPTQDMTENEVNGSAQPGGIAVGVQRPQQSPLTQDMTGNEVNGSAQPGGTAVGVQRPQQAPPTQTPQGQNLCAGTDESVIGCCGFYLGRRRS